MEFFFLSSSSLTFIDYALQSIIWPLHYFGPEAKRNFMEQAWQTNADRLTADRMSKRKRAREEDARDKIHSLR